MSDANGIDLVVTRLAAVETAMFRTRVLAALVVIFCLLVFLLAARSAPMQIIDANEINVRDEAGKTRIRSSADTHAPRISILDEHGTVVVELSSTLSPPIVGDIQDLETGELRGTKSRITETSCLRIADVYATPRVELSVGRDGSGTLRFLDKAGLPVSVLPPPDLTATK